MLIGGTLISIWDMTLLFLNIVPKRLFSDSVELRQNSIQSAFKPDHHASLNF